MRLSVIVLSFFASVTLLLGQHTMVLPTASDCHAVDAWVQAHPSELPQNLNQVLQFPDAWRRRVVAASPPEVQANIWREQITGLLEEDRTLSEAQRRVISASLALISEPTFYTKVAPEGLMRETAELEQRAREAFPNGNERAVFYRLGPVGSQRSAFLDYCDCVSAYLDCGGGGERCVAGGCVEQPTGCGYLGHSKCTGLCKAPVNPPPTD